MKRTTTILLTWLLALVAGAVHAEDVAGQLAAKMAKLFPGEKVTDITPAPIPGLYEVMVGASLFYVSADGRYVVHGDLIDLDAHVNVSDQRRAQARKQVFEAMDSTGFIEFPAKTKETRKTLYVFTDIDCTYCRKMHNEVGQLNSAGVTVRYLAFPRTGTTGPSFDKAVAVWCAADRQEALTRSKLGKTVDSRKCDNPVAKEYELGNAMGVTGTPSVYTEQGKHIGGYVPAAELIKMIDDGKI
ncbi:MAG: DsbC family protein [Proteobacteria bacterium]|nr:DsbC family protein [Pseudomonadota bacterium]